MCKHYVCSSPSSSLDGCCFYHLFSLLLFFCLPSHILHLTSLATVLSSRVFIGTRFIVQLCHTASLHELALLDCLFYSLCGKATVLSITVTCFLFSTLSVSFPPLFLSHLNPPSPADTASVLTPKFSSFLKCDV